MMIIFCNPYSVFPESGSPKRPVWTQIEFGQWILVWPVSVNGNFFSPSIIYGLRATAGSTLVTLSSDLNKAKLNMY
jgi:hypothetical protein